MLATTDPGRTQIGRYVELEPLGRGAMGSVFRARDPELDRVVAIKLLIDSSPAFVARFRREAQAVAKLVHPNVVQVYDFGVDESGRPYFVMELLDGRPLDRLLREEGRLDPATVLQYGEQAADALAAAHRIGIVHRDIKPGNLVLDKQGMIKVVDFGIARVAEEGAAQLTNAATLLGTPGYMSPEQAQGKTVDGRADVYSLGVTLYELLSGEPPFPGSDPISIVVKSLEQPLPDLRRSGTGVPEELVVLVEKMTTKDPAQRLPSMTAVKHAMREANRRPRFAAGSMPTPNVSGVGETVAASLPATEVTPPPPARRGPWIPLLFLGAAAVSAAVVWFFLRGPTPPGVTPPNLAAAPAASTPDAAPAAAAKPVLPSGPLRVAVLKFKNLSGDAALDMLERGIPETAVSALAGQIPKITLLERNDLESNITEIDRGGDLHFDPETVAKLGQLEGIEYAVLGGIQAAKDEIRITARVVRVVNGEVLHTILHTGKGSVFEAQDAVAKLIDEKLRLLAAKEGR